LLPRAWAVFVRPLPAPRFPALGRAQLAQLARAAAVPFTACGWHRGSTCQGHLLPSHAGVRFLSIASPTESSLPNLSFLVWSVSGLYKSRLHIFPPPSNSFAVSRELPRRHSELGALPRHHRPPSRAPHRLRADFVFGSYLGELALFPTPSRCFSFAR
jgi:hypothetical protein